MTPASPLALLIATGVQAEAVVRVVVETLDADWQRLIDKAHAPNVDGLSLEATAALEAIAPYRALLGAVVAAWDGPDELSAGVVKIGGAS